jgi:hypothetical protein
MADKTVRKRNVKLIGWVTLAIVCAYPLTVGPLAFFQGVGLINKKEVDLIRPLYAPLRLSPGAVLVLGRYEEQCNELGRRFLHWLAAT